MNQFIETQNQDEIIPNDILRIISSRPRFKILNALWNAKKRFAELTQYVKPEQNARSLLCWHLRCLKAHYLICHEDDMYYLSDRGRIITKALKVINNSERFIATEQ